MRIAINGFGRVGKALLEFLKSVNDDIDVVYIGRSKRYWLSNGVSVSKINMDEINFSEKNEEDFEILDILKQTRPDFWFELTQTSIENKRESYTLVKNLLEARINVILANKSPLLYNYVELKRIADENEVYMGLSAVMGASLPTFYTGYYGTMGSEILKIEAILNGTSNFVLNKIEEGYSLAESIKIAIDMGIAEPNYSYDIDGIDSAIKMNIITKVLLNKNIELDLTKVLGLRSIKEEVVRESLKDNKRFKLIAKYEDGVIDVRPKKIPFDDVFSNVSQSQKAIRFTTQTLSDITITGGKSGLLEVSASMYRDLCWMKELISK